MFPPPPARSQYSVLIKDSVGVQSGQNFPLGAFGAHGLLTAAPLATNCWPAAPRGGGGAGGRGSWRPRTRGVPPPPGNILHGCTHIPHGHQKMRMETSASRDDGQSWTVNGSRYCSKRMFCTCFAQGSPTCLCIGMLILSFVVPWTWHCGHGGSVLMLMSVV